MNHATNLSLRSDLAAAPRGNSSGIEACRSARWLEESLSRICSHDLWSWVRPFHRLSAHARLMSGMWLCDSPSHALHFATYESAKELYGGNNNGHRPLPTAFAGATAVIVHDGCMTPADVIKQRLQVRGLSLDRTRPRPKSALDSQ